MTRGYFFLSMFFIVVTGWSYGLMMGVPLSMVSITYPLVIFTTIWSISWLFFGKKLLSRINRDHGVSIR